jgi:hypothetical protein
LPETVKGLEVKDGVSARACYGFKAGAAAPTEL